MKIVLIGFFIGTFLTFAQIPEEAFTISNSLVDLWGKKDSDDAINASEKLFELAPSLFTDRIHNSLAQAIKIDSGLGNESAFLQELYQKKNSAINAIITPIVFWKNALEINTNDKANVVLEKFSKRLTDSLEYNSKTELYGLLILEELNRKKMGNVSLKEKILNKIVSNLAVFPNMYKVGETPKINRKRAWSRFLLSFAQYGNFLGTGEERYLKKAANLSPDYSDMQYYDAYFYDANLLLGDVQDIGYKDEYFDFLDKKNKTQLAFDLLLEETYTSPVSAKLQKLKAYYKNLNNNVSFESYWYDYINSKMEAVPDMGASFGKDVFDLTKKRENWIYIDVWGTWCAPCLEELPELDTMVKKYNALSSPEIRVYSFSYRSSKLEEFMQKHKYSFPVVEIEDEIIDKFKISRFPEKILISPKNNYVKIPFGVNWQEYIKNYALLP